MFYDARARIQSSGDVKTRKEEENNYRKGDEEQNQTGNQALTRYARRLRAGRFLFDPWSGH
jgi:hypothetical protein